MFHSSNALAHFLFFVIAETKWIWDVFWNGDGIPQDEIAARGTDDVQTRTSLLWGIIRKKRLK